MTVIIALETLMIGILIGSALAVDIMLRLNRSRNYCTMVGVTRNAIGLTIREKERAGWQFVSMCSDSRRLGAVTMEFRSL